MSDEFKRAFELGRKHMNKYIQIKLIKRANHILKNVTNPDSPMILVATELKIQADELNDILDMEGEK